MRVGSIRSVCCLCTCAFISVTCGLESLVPAPYRSAATLNSAIAKQHSSTVALVPPEEVWPQVQAARTALRDKGLYRWPPHMNLLYPFVEPALVIRSMQPDPRHLFAAALLASSLEALAPPVITLDALACFGGRSRGVLYACCSSDVDTEALQQMQEALQASMPFCDDQQRKNEGGKRGSFTPHMTLSHFSSREEAEAAKALLAPTWQPLTFSCAQAVHLMYREGGCGQFERACTLSFGGEAMSTFFSPPRRWESMPAVEEEWVRDARKNAYRRGIGGGRGGQRSRRPRRSREEREAIQARTPEEIAEIRAQRAAKRARLEAGEL